MPKAKQKTTTPNQFTGGARPAVDRTRSRQRAPGWAGLELYPVAALYIDPAGPYPWLASECYDLARDARTYAGPLPVVAHPPCAQWSRLKHFANVSMRDLDCFAYALEAVRTYGGVLEHPAGSSAWSTFGLPPPESGLFPDAWGGVSYEIAQGDYGFPAPKRTWLYAVRLPMCPLRSAVGGQRGRVQSMPSNKRHLTPVDLAERLCRWAVSESGSSVSPGQSLMYETFPHFGARN